MVFRTNKLGDNAGVQTAYNTEYNLGIFPSFRKLGVGWRRNRMVSGEWELGIGIGL
jgi:hypothetical protein